MSMAAILLAGGKSQRMGQDKERLRFGTEPLLQRIYESLSRFFSPVIVIANNPEHFPLPGICPIPDRYPDRGPLEGLATGLEHVETASALLVACDMPFLQSELLEFLAGQTMDAAAIVPRTRRGTEPLLAIYSRSLLPELRRQLDLGVRSMQSFLAPITLRELPPEIIELYDPAGHSFWNLNSPTDYESALLFLREHFDSATPQVRKGVR
ncbi:MAG: molybdenum cofactor guanylyltransferase [Cyanobacteria bacterium NC_groundwater_1444_Ag_S-0.65um_54_12]|nr:molybdenum cofactor guanylyltransferase [Cyanobacteria bacterium NC_groundwater_1444_Ag_S-0.65um_54_12]